MLNSLTKFLTHTISLLAELQAINSASAVDSAVTVYFVALKTTGAEHNFITIPVIDFLVSRQLA